MDRYEYTVKSEKIRQLAERHDYATAARIAETIDWSRVQNMRTLSLAAEVFEENGQYDEAKNVLLTAYDLVPVGKGLLYKLCRICLKQNRIPEAENYYDAYAKVAPDDPERLQLRYDLACARKEPVGNRISILEQYHKLDIDERLDYDLAELYHRAGRGRDCVAICDEIILWFGDGDYVDAAMELKRQYSGAVAEDQRKQDEAAENRRRRIEELENETGLNADEITFGLGRAYDEADLPDDPAAEEGEGFTYEEELPADETDIIDLSVFEEAAGEEPMDGGSMAEDSLDEDDEYYSPQDERDLYEIASFGVSPGRAPWGGMASDAPAEEDAPVSGGFFADGGEDLPAEHAEDHPEEFAEDHPEEFADAGPAPLSLSDFVQAGADNRGPALETFSWMDTDGGDAGNVGKWIWNSLEQAEKDRNFRPDADFEPEFSDLDRTGAGDAALVREGAPASDEDFSRDLAETLNREVAAFDEAEAPSDMIPVAAYYEAPSAADGTEEQKVALGEELPQLRGHLDPSLAVRLVSMRMFDEYGLVLADADIPGMYEDGTFDAPWGEEGEPTKKLDELQDLRAGEEPRRPAAPASRPAAPVSRPAVPVSGADLVDPDRAQEDGSGYLDLAAIAHESEARMAVARARAEEEKAARAARAAATLTVILAESSDPEKATSRATEIIRDTRESMGVEAPLSAKVTGNTLNRRGMQACMQRLAGRDLIILEADDLDDEILGEIAQTAKTGEYSGIMVLTDIPWKLRELVSRCPALAEISVYEEESGQAALPFTEAILAGRSIEAEPAEEQPAEAGLPAEEQPAAEVPAETELPAEPELAVEPEEAQPVAYFESIASDEEPDLDDVMARAFSEAPYTADDRQDDDESETSGIGLTGKLAAELARMMEEDGASEASEEAAAVSGMAELQEAEPEEYIDTEAFIEPEEYVEPEAYSEPEEYVEPEAYEEPEDYIEPEPYIEPEDAYDDAQPADDMSAEETFGAVRGFAAYAFDYAAAMDCVIDEKANLAVYACAEDILNAGGQLTAERARALVDDAVKDAEHTSFMKVFSRKYDKEGRLILREQHFHI